MQGMIIKSRYKIPMINALLINLYNRYFQLQLYFKEFNLNKPQLYLIIQKNIIILKPALQ